MHKSNERAYNINIEQGKEKIKKEVLGMEEIRIEAINELDNLIVEWTERGERLGIDFSEQIKEMENLKSKYEREVSANA